MKALKITLFLIFVTGLTSCSQDTYKNNGLNQYDPKYYELYDSTFVDAHGYFCKKFKSRKGLGIEMIEIYGDVWRERMSAVYFVRDGQMDGPTKLYAPAPG